MQQRVVIVGAGMIGAAVAFELSRRGVGVIVLDANEPARGCSFGNSGLIAPGHAPMAAPGVCERYLAERDNPASAGRFAPIDDPALERWIGAFRAACSPGVYARGMDALSGLAHLVMPVFREWTEELGNSYDLRENGALLVACSGATFDALRAEADELRARGLPAEILNADETHERVPGLTDAVLGGLFHSDWATIEPYRFATAVMRAAQERGAEVRNSARVARVDEGFVELDSGERVEGDAVVIATGADARELLAPLGVDLPMASALGWHADLRLKNAVEAGVVIADREVILTPMEDRLRLSGLLEITMRPKRDVNRGRIEQLLHGPEGVLRGITGEVVSEWVGRRPCLPDGLPAIGLVPGRKNVYTATGHARMGLSLGPATGRLLAEMICGETPSAPVEAFTPARFAAQRV